MFLARAVKVDFLRFTVWFLILNRKKKQNTSVINRNFIYG